MRKQGCRVGALVEGTTYDKARKILERRGEFTFKQIRYEVGNLFSASLAMAAYRTYRKSEDRRYRGVQRKELSAEEMVDKGRERRTRQLLSNFVKVGFLQRVGPAAYVWIGQEQSDSLYAAVARVVEEQRGACTVSDVLSHVRDRVTSTTAIKVYFSSRKRSGRDGEMKRPPSMEAMAESGKRHMVRGLLDVLIYRGKIKRIAKGVYASLKAAPLISGKL